MNEKTLFGVIAALLLSILGLGIYAAAKNPDVSASLPSTAVSVVTSAIKDAATAVTPGTKVDTDDDSDDDNAVTTQSVPASPAQAVQPAAGGYTMAQVAAHATASSCYTAIQGLVYDLTPFIKQHPGGSAILQLCGIEGTAKFMAQHGGQGKPEKELASLKIGALAQ